jgi:hypothetical protein
MKHMKTFAVVFASHVLLAACAGSTHAPDARDAERCPSGQVLVCTGGVANSRVKDSKLNESDICLCRQQDNL